MNPLTFHQKLNFLSESLNSNILINRVLNRSDDFPIPDKPDSSSLAYKVSTAIESFIKDNQAQLAKSDAPALKKLQTLIPSFCDSLK